MTRNGGGAVVESCVPGRVRFRFPHEERREDVFGNVESTLRGLDGVVDVTANPSTGSVLVKHDPAVLSEALLVSYARDVHIVSSAASKDTDTDAEPWPETSELARSIMGEIKRMDRFVSRLSGGTIDGKMAAVILLLGGSATRALLGKKQVPAPWHALLWYSYSLFIQWNKNNKSIGSA